MHKKRTVLLVVVGSVCVLLAVLCLLWPSRSVLPIDDDRLADDVMSSSASSATMTTTTAKTTAITTTTTATTAVSTTISSTKSRTTPAKSTIITEPGHQHVFREKVVTATCDREGYVKHGCECGYVYEDNFKPKLAHNYGWLLIKASTTKETGIKKWRCVNCGGGEDAHEEVIPKKKAAAKIDSRVEVGFIKFTNEPMYTLAENCVIDKRTWGEAPSIEVYNGDCMKVTYYNKQGEVVTFTVEHPEDPSYDCMVRIMDDGTYEYSEVISFS